MSVVVEQEFIKGVKKKYVGKWVAVKGKKVVAVSDSHDELIKELKKKRLDGAYVFYSASSRDKEYQFLF